ncbi:MAG: vitamin K epoxide reductase family protein [Chloroflexota bacterium]|nr:vitamin K epoxide reductase family protein [Chloroflexota bacterium]MDE2854330.1 vitamin K epoxide reductase family protein [Chloroflexota bacterium]MDE2947224.1 vitamin K epoxide reductase family protein [Chloroflexota bacterium]
MTLNSEGESRPQDSRKTLVRRAQMLFVLIGLIVAGYLSYLKVANAPAACLTTGPFNCNVVLNSQYSELAGLPIAWLGFAVYVFIGLALWLETRNEFMRQYGRLIVFGIGLFAWLFSMWLVYVQVALLEALCPWCLTHETNFTILFALVCYRVYRETFGAS